MFPYLFVITNEVKQSGLFTIATQTEGLLAMTITV